MDCDIIHNIFLNFEARVANEVQKHILHSDFYANNVNRKPWPNGQGRTFTYPSYERAGLGTGFLPFEPIAAFGDGNTCDIPSVEVKNYAATVRNVTLYQGATNTPDFCLRDFEFDYQIEEQLAISVKNMADATRFNWGQELQKQYISLAKNKLIYTADALTNANWLATAPTLPLDWNILDYVYEQLRYVITPQDGSGVDEEGKVILTAVGAYDVFNQLKLQDSNFRADLLAVTSGGSKEQRTLIGSPGMPSKATYRGWKFETVQFAPHYDLVDGEWVQHFPYTLEDKTPLGVGCGLEINPAYVSANFTDVVVFTKSLFDHLVPAAPKSRNGYEWNAEVDWSGAHKWRRLPINKEDNPDGAKGFWRSVYAYGPKLQRPDLGWVIRVQRCKPTFGEFTCGLRNEPEEVSVS
jgi:hypothetical protein